METATSQVSPSVVAEPRAGIDVWRVLLLGALLAAALLRLWDLGGPTLTHPEAYIPGIDLIPGLSEPPPRHGFMETLSWHFHKEWHPVGFYMMMWAWVKLAGTSEFALRLPSALFGIASVWLVSRLGAAAFNRRTGAVAALLLALHGFHIYWSQMARMYAAGTALALLSTWLLVMLMRSGGRRPWLETGYAAAVVATTQTDVLLLALPFLHIAWVVLITPASPLRAGSLWRPGGVQPARILQVQAVALAVISCEFVRTALLARHGGATPDSSPHFLLHYLDFGFLFDPGAWFSSSGAPAMLPVVALAATALTLALAGMRVRGAELAAGPSPVPLPFQVVVAGVIAGVALTLFYAAISERHRAALATLAVFPLACLLLPAIAARVKPVLNGIVPGVVAWVERLSPFGLLIALIAFGPPLVFYAMSLVKSVLAPRAFLPFVPFFLLLIAAGFAALPIRSTLRALAGTALALLFLASYAYFRAAGHGPRDYKGVAAIIAREERPGDAIVVRRQHWADTPFFYYLPHARYLTPEQVTRIGGSRAWVTEWSEEGVVNHDERRAALERVGYRQQEQWTVGSYHATLFEPGTER